MHSSTVFFLALQRLRAPLIALITVFATGMAGLVAIPGVDAAGQAWHMTFAQALYFMTYTATTIGFGEIPHAFTDTQRLWVTAMIFLSVLGWAYMLTNLMRLVGDHAFRNALAMTRFEREVARIHGPFYIICGIGETGLLVCRALDTMGYRFVAIDSPQGPVDELELAGLVQDPPSLVSDARLPTNLLAAGLKRGTCMGVLALTDNDRVNLAVTMAVRLLKPDTPVLARAQSRETAANMASFDTDHIINPFATFGIILALAISAPVSYRLLTWLTGRPGGRIGDILEPPRGHWVVCGYGRFGKEVVRALRQEGLVVTVIDPKITANGEFSVVQGAATNAGPLREAGIEQAVGIVAGLSDDVDNLSIVVTARELNKNLFTIVRQNLRANQTLFDAFDSDMTMVPSEVVASECLALAHTPMLGRLIDVVLDRNETWADALIKQLLKRAGAAVPELWSIRVNASNAPALHRALMFEKREISVYDLLRDPADRERSLGLVVLGLTRGKAFTVLPDEDTKLESGDEVLFAGHAGTRDAQWPLLRDATISEYVLTGIERPQGWLWRAFSRRTKAETGRGPNHKVQESKAPGAN